MADSFIQLPADSTGKQLDTVAVNMGIGTTSVHREKVVLADPSSTTGFATVTSSAGVRTSLSSGTVTLSSQITVTATGPVTITSGLISVTSGTITSTAATNPWSSAPGFNVPVVSVSSGLVQISGIPAVVPATSGTQRVVVTSSGSVFPVFVIVTSISNLSGSAATLWTLDTFSCQGNAAIIRLYDATTGTVVMTASNAVAMLLVGMQGTATPLRGSYNWGPTGMAFSGACSFDCVLTATSTAAVAPAGVYVSALIV